MSGELLAVDPGLGCTGAALFGERGQLRAGRRFLGEDSSSDSPHVRAHYLARRVVAWYQEHRSGGLDRLVYERPQIYRVGKQSADPNKVVTLAEIGASIAGMLLPAEIQSPTPAAWADGTTKSELAPSGRRRIAKDYWSTTRGSRLRGQLTNIELALLAGANHDVLDAVSIGLWALGRWRPARVYPGAV